MSQTLPDPVEGRRTWLSIGNGWYVEMIVEDGRWKQTGTVYYDQSES